MSRMRVRASGRWGQWHGGTDSGTALEQQSGGCRGLGANDVKVGSFAVRTVLNSISEDDAAAAVPALVMMMDG